MNFFCVDRITAGYGKSKVIENILVKYFHICPSILQSVVAKLALLSVFAWRHAEFLVKELGKIKHLGFSYHGNLEFFLKLIDKYKWDFVQLQINYYDWENQNAKAYYEALEERNIPCIVMEPVRGGSLHTLNDEAKKVFEELGDASAASYALRYVAQLPNVLVTLSGMSTYEQVVDNLKTFDECKPLTDIETEAIEKASGTYGRFDEAVKKIDPRKE